jgi:tetratricopeptide (TPR) repeat protein
MRALVGLGIGMMLAAAPALAATPLDGEYESPLGRVRIAADGAGFRGTVVEPSAACRLGAGEAVLRGTLLDDSLAGQVRVCLSGCGKAEEWASAVLLVGDGKLSGAVHVAAKGCKSPLGKRGGIAFARVATSTGPRKASKADRDRARAIMKDGAAWLNEGNFEKARKRFLEAIEVDPALPEAYNGAGVTYRMRNDLARALEWYKKALAVDPDFGDAYYNMACVYALEGDKDLALRYLQIAALNGYATAEGMDQDPDLASLRDEAGYRALVKAKM